MIQSDVSRYVYNLPHGWSSNLVPEYWDSISSGLITSKNLQVGWGGFGHGPGRKLTNQHILTLKSELKIHYRRYWRNNRSTKIKKLYYV